MGIRTRNYATVIYPESAPEDLFIRLSDLKIPAFLSPLHDKDINPTGEPKKPHYHLMIMFEGVKSEAQAKEVFEQFNGVGCEIIQSIRGYARYLCHLDNPEKVQYDKDKVSAYGGADYFNVINLITDKYAVIDEMINFCEEQDIVSFRNLFLYAKYNRRDWFRSLCDNSAFIMKEYLKTRQWDNSQVEQNKNDE